MEAEGQQLDLLSALRELSDPDENHVGKYQRPGDAAETQREAAIFIYPRTGNGRRRVLDCIADSIDGATDEEVQDWLGMNPSTQRPRRVELVEGGWVCDSGLTRKTRSGTSAVVWALTEKAMEAR